MKEKNLSLDDCVKKVSLDIKIGDKLILPIHMEGPAVAKKCKVIWIHPLKRFFRVAYETPQGMLTESFSFVGDLK